METASGTVDDEVRFVASVLRHPAGFDLSFAATISVRTTEQATVEVELDGECVRSFPLSSLEEAARCFVTLRRERRLGLDFESPGSP